MVFLPLALFAHVSTSQDRVIRTVDAAVTSLLITEGLKSVIREERPNHDDTRSFPSEHATLAFAIATTQAHYDPTHAQLWYLGATAVGIWRVTSKEHFVQDVVAGSLIGYLTAEQVVRQPRGLLITPLFEHDRVGVNLIARF